MQSCQAHFVIFHSSSCCAGSLCTEAELISITNANAVVMYLIKPYFKSLKSTVNKLNQINFHYFDFSYQYFCSNLKTVQSTFLSSVCLFSGCKVIQIPYSNCLICKQQMFSSLCLDSQRSRCSWKQIKSEATSASPTMKLISVVF